MAKYDPSELADMLEQASAGNSLSLTCSSVRAAKLLRFALYHARTKRPTRVRLRIVRATLYVEPLRTGILHATTAKGAS